MVSVCDPSVCALEEFYSLAVRCRILKTVIKSYLVAVDDTEHEQMLGVTSVVEEKQQGGTGELSWGRGSAVLE